MATYQNTLGQYFPTQAAAAASNTALGTNPSQLNFNPSGILDTNILNGNTLQPQIPIATPTITPQSFVQGLQLSPLQLAPAGAGVGAQEAGRTALTRRLAQAQNQLLGRGAEQLRLEEQAGISGINKEIQGLNEQFAQKQSNFMQAAENYRSGGVLSQELSTGKQAQIERNKAVELGGLSIQILAKQGKLDSAKAEVDRVLELEFEPIRQEIENTKTFLELNYQDLTRADKIRADELQRQNQKDMVALNAFYDIKKMAMNEAIKTNPALASKYASATSLADMAKINADDFNTGSTPSAKIEALNNTVTLLDELKNSTGMNSRVGPVGIARRFLAVADMFGAGDAFAGSVHQLTSQQTLQALLNLKQQGGTLGALSDGERRALEAAATKIGAWEKKDKQGVGQGIWDISQKEFTKELNKLTELTNTAIVRAGGQVGLTNQDYAEVSALMQSPVGFNPAGYFPQTQ